MTDIGEAKRTLRRSVRRRISTADAGSRADASATVCGLLPSLLPGDSVLAFASKTDEIDLTALLLALLLRDGSVVLPRVSGEVLALHRVTDLAQLVVGPWQIPEPAEGLPPVAPEAVTAAVVPGVAFDRFGHRLGRGKGFYDRLLPGLGPNVPRIGVGFGVQVVARVPVADHDQPLDAVVTDLGALHATLED